MFAWLAWNVWRALATFICSVIYKRPPSAHKFRTLCCTCNDPPNFCTPLTCLASFAMVWPGHEGRLQLLPSCVWIHACVCCATIGKEGRCCLGYVGIGLQCGAAATKWINNVGTKCCYRLRAAKTSGCSGKDPKRFFKRYILAVVLVLVRCGRGDVAKF